MTMHYLFATKHGADPKLVATFSSEQQLLAYVRWATLAEVDGKFKFEHQSALAGYDGYEASARLLTDDDPGDVTHNPSPTML